MSARFIAGKSGVNMNWQKTVPLIVGAIMAASGVTNVQARTAGVTTKIKRVILDAGNVGRTLGSGYTTIEHQEVWCGSYSSCTIAMSIMANVGEATCREEWEIVGLVDGNSVDGGTQLDVLPLAGNTQTRTWQGVYSVAEGYHTVSFELYLPCSANANQWSVRYLITKP